MVIQDKKTRLAKLFKERENFTAPSITTGIVISPPPEPQIRLNEVVILYKERLIFSSHLLEGYGRKIKITDTDCGTTTVAGDPSHTHNIAELHIDTTMEWTDTLLPGDEVILMPTMDKQLYYVSGKAVRFK